MLMRKYLWPTPAECASSQLAANFEHAQSRTKKARSFEQASG